MPDDARQVSRTVEVDAPAATIFDLLTDPRMHVSLDGSGSLKGVLRGPQRLRLGDGFWMRMRLGLPYVIRNEVVEYEEDRLLAWRHVGRHRWRWELEPLGQDRTRVTETFDWSTSLAPRVLELARVPAMNAGSMTGTLQRLEELVRH